MLEVDPTTGAEPCALMSGVRMTAPYGPGRTGLADPGGGGHADTVEVRFIDADGVHARDADDVVELFAHGDGSYWIDIPTWDDDAEAVLTGLGCHPLVIEGCRQRNYVPTVHGYDDYVFITTPSPYLGRAGHVHLLSSTRSSATTTW